MPASIFSIEISTSVATLEPNQIILGGKFHISNSDPCLSVDGAGILNHLVLLISDERNHNAVMPFKDNIVFNDDIKSTETGYSGFFNINVFDKINFLGKGKYYMMCSLGSITSNIVKVMQN